MTRPWGMTKHEYEQVLLASDMVKFEIAFGTANEAYRWAKCAAHIALGAE